MCLSVPVYIVVVVHVRLRSYEVSSVHAGYKVPPPSTKQYLYFKFYLAKGTKCPWYRVGNGTKRPNTQFIVTILLPS